MCVLLDGLIEFQCKGGVHTWVRMGDEVCWMKVIIVVSVVSGDAKSSDIMCGQFGGKICVGRVPCLCMTLFADLDNPWQVCYHMQMPDPDLLY
jgi:hypothetical protein